MFLVPALAALLAPPIYSRLLARRPTRDPLDDDDDSEATSCSGRWKQSGEGDSSDDEMGLPTNLKVGGKGTSKRAEKRAKRRAAAAAAATMGDGDEGMGVVDEEALWKQTLKQAAKAEEDHRAMVKETARSSQALLHLANTAIAPPPPPEGSALVAVGEGAQSSGSGLTFELRKPADKGKSTSAADGEAKRARVAHVSAVSAEGPSGEVLLPNWFAARDEAGTTYFFNSATLESCWAPPLRWPQAVANA